MNTKSSKQTIFYRPEIDGLRAISIALVILFHYDFNFFNGGYIGVDVFFVISGYLIFQIIDHAQSTGNFKIKTFLLRRLRRLGPSYFSVLILCYIISFFILSPTHFERFSGNYIFSFFGLTNLWLFGETGYFDTDVIFKPFVHLWSLSVEIQFYISFCLIIVICFFFKKKKLILISIFFLSFLIALILHSSNFDYYFLPSRYYEFLIGVFAFMAQKKVCNLSKFKNTIFFYSGLLLILCSSVFFNKNTPMPSAFALLPTIGAALVLCTKPISYFSKWLKSPVLVHLGKISYPLYLIHWPIWTFSNYTLISDFNIYIKLTLIIISLIIAEFLYRLIEKPITGNIKIPYNNRLGFKILNGKIFILSFLILLIFTLPLSYLSWKQGGWDWRFNKELRNHLSVVKNKDLEKRKLFSKKIENISAEKKDIINYDAFENRILIIGDSHSVDVLNGILLLDINNKTLVRRVRLQEDCQKPKWSVRSQIFQLYYGTNRPKRRKECDKDIVFFKNFTKKFDPTITIIANHWTLENLTFLENTFKLVKSNVYGKLILWGNISFPFDIPTLALILRDTKSVNKKIFLMNRDEEKVVNQKLNSFSKLNNIKYVDILSEVCSLNNKECNLVDENGNLLFRDKNHFSFEGLKSYQRIFISLLK